MSVFLEVLGHLADVYSENEDYRTAFKYSNEALEILKSALPPDHPDLAICNLLSHCINIQASYFCVFIILDMNRNASCLEGLERFDEAIAMYEAALPLLRAHSSVKDHLTVCEHYELDLITSKCHVDFLGLNDYGACLEKMDRYADAAVALKECLEIERNIYPPGHPELCSSKLT